ncbi:MAG: basic secretory family protein [Pirellula sp.]|jgi:hypothetical protein|nr:basic secretory family protein [Pirellula sp.]
MTPLATKSFAVRSKPIWLSLVCMAMILRAQAISQDITQTEQGFNKLTTSRISIITDLELDDELKRWPVYLDQAIEQWKTVFAPVPIKLEGLQTTVYLIGDKAKWQRLGLLDQLPNLIDGYQAGDQLYVVDQPSTYYRRLLFLHEATHWIMYRWQGGAGSPWLMEGMADYQGTHELREGRLRLGFFPSRADQVPYWGRLRLISDTMNKSSAPKLSEIVAFRDMQERRMERYSWSWAACTFFATHPELRDDFQHLYRGQLDYSFESSARWLRALENDWKKLSIQWRCFVDDLDYGMDLTRSALEWGSLESRLLTQGEESDFMLSADRGWQSIGILLESGESIELSAEGRVVVREFADGKKWSSEPPGLTVEYHRGKPLGCLIGVLASVEQEQPSACWETVRIGKRAVLKASQKSILLLKINESSQDLADNQGTFNVSIRKAGRLKE